MRDAFGAKHDAAGRGDDAAADIAELVEILRNRHRPVRIAERGHHHLVGPHQIMATRRMNVEQGDQRQVLLADEFDAIAVANLHGALLCMAISEVCMAVSWAHREGLGSP
jgi:hypothetical protein